MRNSGDGDGLAEGDGTVSILAWDEQQEEQENARERRPKPARGKRNWDVGLKGSLRSSSAIARGAHEGIFWRIVGHPERDWLGSDLVRRLC